LGNGRGHVGKGETEGQDRGNGPWGQNGSQIPARKGIEEWHYAAGAEGKVGEWGKAELGIGK